MPPHILGIQAMKKASKKYRIEYSESTRGRVVAQVMAAQLREVREQEDEEVSLPDSQEEEEEDKCKVAAVSRPRRSVHYL